MIGSLFWERDRWASTALDFAHAHKIDVPIRYGRVSMSRDRGYTMVLCSAATPRGTAYLVPFVRPVRSFENLFEMGRVVAIAEGFKSGLSSSWGTIALATFGGASEVLRHQWSEQTAGAAPAIVAAYPSGQAPLDSSSTLASEVLPDAMGFDLVFVAVTAPTNPFPTPTEIANAMGPPSHPNKAFNYFAGNRRAGITTFEDRSILEKLRLRGFPHHAVTSDLAPVS